MSWFYTFSVWVVKLLLKLLSRWQVIGRERVPLTGPIIVVANHLHLVDPPVLSAGLPRRVVFMAKEELFRSWLFPLVRGFGAFPVRKKAIDRTALGKAFRVLRSGLALGTFPEGTRSKSGGLQKAFLGAAFIALRAQVPILPVAIYGTEKLKGFWFFQRPSITVHIGKPFYPPAENRITKAVLQSFTEIIMRQIAQLLPPQYMGIYKEVALEDREGSTDRLLLWGKESN